MMIPQIHPCQAIDLMQIRHLVMPQQNVSAKSKTILKVKGQIQMTIQAIQYLDLTLMTQILKMKTQNIRSVHFMTGKENGTSYCHQQMVNSVYTLTNTLQPPKKY